MQKQGPNINGTTRNRKPNSSGSCTYHIQVIRSASRHVTPNTCQEENLRDNTTDLVFCRKVILLKLSRSQDAVSVPDDKTVAKARIPRFFHAEVFAAVFAT
jgi:hypothetical protein